MSLFSPVFGQDGAVDGVFCACMETTDKIIGKRRLDTLRKLGVKPAEVQLLAETCKTAADVLGKNPYDLPFAAIYLMDAKGEQATLGASVGFAGGDHPLPLSVSSALDDGSPWPLGPALRTRRAQEVDLSAMDRKLPGGPWTDPAAQALVLPIIVHENLAGLLVVGISPRRAFDDAYQTFLNLAAVHIDAAIADARAYEAERRRAESLADLDRAKTTFFNNISHELRTPLTLILGPLEDAMRDNPEARASLQMVHRNTLRLLKLVNTLLDFSRIEAGRSTARTVRRSSSVSSAIACTVPGSFSVGSTVGRSTSKPDRSTIGNFIFCLPAYPVHSIPCTASSHTTGAPPLIGAS